MSYRTPRLEAYIILGQELQRRAYVEDSPEQIHDWLLRQLKRLTGGEEEARLLWQDSFELYEEIMAERAEQAALPEGEQRILTWPWSSWSRLLDTFDPGVLAVLSAADGAGKTLYSENLAEHWAKEGLHVVFIHFELNRSLMLDRRMARHSGILRRDLKAGELTEYQERQRKEANKRLLQWPGSITYVHTPGWTMERVMGEVSSLVAEDICDVFIVDYLEKAAPSNQQVKTMGTNIFAREADNVEIVKRNAEMMERPAFLLAQLNKFGKQQSFANLDRSAIRGAGEKTERANIVILLHRESSDKRVVKVRIDKNTMGPCGTFEQYMEGARFLVADIATDGPLNLGGQ